MLYRLKGAFHISISFNQMGILTKLKKSANELFLHCFSLEIFNQLLLYVRHCALAMPFKNLLKLSPCHCLILNVPYLVFSCQQSLPVQLFLHSSSLTWYTKPVRNDTNLSLPVSFLTIFLLCNIVLQLCQIWPLHTAIPIVFVSQIHHPSYPSFLSKTFLIPSEPEVQSASTTLHSYFNCSNYATVRHLHVYFPPLATRLLIGKKCFIDQ